MTSGKSCLVCFSHVSCYLRTPPCRKIQIRRLCPTANSLCCSVASARLSCLLLTGNSRERQPWRHSLLPPTSAAMKVCAEQGEIGTGKVLFVEGRRAAGIGSDKAEDIAAAVMAAAASAARSGTAPIAPGRINRGVEAVYGGALKVNYAAIVCGRAGRSCVCCLGFTESDHSLTLSRNMPSGVLACCNGGVCDGNGERYARVRRNAIRLIGVGYRVAIIWRRFIRNILRLRVSYCRSALLVAGSSKSAEQEGTVVRHLSRTFRAFRHVVPVLTMC